MSKPLRNWTTEEKAEIVRRYLTGEHSGQIAKSYGVDRDRIKHILRYAGVQMRPTGESRRKYSLNQDAFNDAPNNPDAAYFIGLLMADGCVEDDGRITLQLAESDRHLVHDFKVFLNAGHPLSDRLCSTSKGTGRHTALHVNSKALAAELRRYGVTPRKTHTAKVSLLEFNPHFWRGVIDGDGSVTIPQTRVSQTILQLSSASQVFHHQFRRFVRSLIPTYRSNATGMNTAVSGWPAIAVLEALYVDTPVALKRKSDSAIFAIAFSKGREDQQVMANRFPDLSVEQIQTAYESMRGWDTVAKSFGITVSGLNRIRKRLGIYEDTRVAHRKRFAADRLAALVEASGKEMQEAYQHGDNLQTIGTAFGIGWQMAQRVLLACGVTVQTHRDWSWLTGEFLIEQRNQSSNWTEVAQKLGLRLSALRGHCKRLGVP